MHLGEIRNCQSKFRKIKKLFKWPGISVSSGWTKRNSLQQTDGTVGPISSLQSKTSYDLTEISRMRQVKVRHNNGYTIRVIRYNMAVGEVADVCLKALDISWKNEESS